MSRTTVVATRRINAMTINTRTVIKTVITTVNSQPTMTANIESVQ